MIKANHTPSGTVFFNMYSTIRLENHFKKIVFEGSFPDTDKPILLIANHFSWWDGFIQEYFNRKVLKRKFHVMMLEKQLQKHMILNKGGAFSIRKNSRDTIKSLQYSLELLQDANNLVLIFPQGEIQSIYTHSFKFERGIYYLLKQLNNDVQLIFNINLIDYFSESKPSLYIYYKSYILKKERNIESIENDFNTYAKECMSKQKPL